MPLIQRKGAQSSQGFGEFAQSSTAATYIEDVFSTYLYTGNGANQIVGNGIALSNTAAWSSYALQQSTNASTCYGSITDSSGNLYLTGYANDGTSNYAFIVKYNSLGSLQWQRKLLQTSASYGVSIKVDSSGNVYAFGQANDGSNYVYLAQYNSSGTLQWQRKLTSAYNFNNRQGGIALDSSNNIYITATDNSGSVQQILIAKYNSSGTIQWKRKLGSSTALQNSSGFGIAVDSSGNSYVSGYYYDGTNYTGIVAKYNTSGTIQWQRKLNETTNTQASNIAVDSTGNIYSCVLGLGATQWTAHLIKYNSSGTVQWQRKLYSAGAYNFCFGLSIDSSDNIYISGGSSGTGGNYSFLAKYNSSGTIQWQRQLIDASSVYSTAYSYTCAADTLGNIYVSGYGYNVTNYYSVSTKLLQDGTTTSGGAILNMIVSSMTDAAGTLTDSASTLTDAVSGATDAAGTATDSAAGMTATSATQVAITSTGGLVWIKDRTNAYNHNLFDTAQGATKYLHSNTTDATATDTVSLTSFNANGFSLGTGNTAGSQVNTSADNFVSWTFRKKAKFFDIVTYTGNGGSGSTVQTINHNLGSVPGAIILKKTNNTSNWVYGSSALDATWGSFLLLNTTGAVYTQPTYNRQFAAAPTSTTFSVTDAGAMNNSGDTYVAYLFASNAGGFGSDGTQNVITCGGFTSTPTASVTLGYEPQWVLIKRIDNASVGLWSIYDILRGASYTTGITLSPNNINADTDQGGGCIIPTATGFNMTSQQGLGSGSFIYIAIRRGPMKTPTVGTSVFSPVTYSGNSTGGRIVNGTGFPSDSILILPRAGGSDDPLYARLIGPGNYLATNGSSAQSISTTIGIQIFNQDGGFTFGSSFPFNYTGATYVTYLYQRAPSFFDVVCYTGNSSVVPGGSQTLTHNLSVTPELIICKIRDIIGDWGVGCSIDWTKTLVLDSTAAFFSGASNQAFSTPTSTQFTVLNNNVTSLNANAHTYVAYLFASCPGVSKVGSYTGTGATQTINCGFTGGARFVLIKRTDSTGDWYVWDTARGMVSGTDPYLLLNSTAAETNANNVYTTSVGFQIVGTGAGINASGGTYLYLAIA